jgi:hypothetical protein
LELHNEIEKVAKELYEKSGRIEGRDLDNWLEAEKIVMARYGKQEKIKTDKPISKKKAVSRPKKTKS